MRALLDTSPSRITRMRSASRIVDRRWAMTKLVRPRIRRSMAVWMRCSVRVSTLLVASSRIRMRLSARMARAMVSSCFWPWLTLDVLVQHGVVAAGQGADEVVGPAFAARSLLVGRVQAGVSDVLAHGALNSHVSCSTMPKPSRRRCGQSPALVAVQVIEPPETS